MEQYSYYYHGVVCRGRRRRRMAACRVQKLLLITYYYCTIMADGRIAGLGLITMANTADYCWIINYYDGNKEEMLWRATKWWWPYYRWGWFIFLLFFSIWQFYYVLSSSNITSNGSVRGPGSWVPVSCFHCWGSKKEMGGDDGVIMMRRMVECYSNNRAYVQWCILYIIIIIIYLWMVVQLLVYCRFEEPNHLVGDHGSEQHQEISHRCCGWRKGGSSPCFGFTINCCGCCWP